MARTDDVFDQPPIVQPQVDGIDSLTVNWTGRYDPVTQSVSTYAQESVAQNGGMVRIINVLKFA